jgi:hypothetical protein
MPWHVKLTDVGRGFQYAMVSMTESKGRMNVQTSLGIAINMNCFPGQM